MADLDRAGLIDLLNRLGSPDDATVLEAARALHRMADEAGSSWNDLIRPQDDGDDEAAAEPSVRVDPDPDNAEVLRLIDRLIRKGVSESTRDDLIEMKQQIGAGEFDREDARYVRALARRLGV